MMAFLPPYSPEVKHGEQVLNYAKAGDRKPTIQNKDEMEKSISLPTNSAQLIVNSQAATHHNASTKNGGVPDTIDSPALRKRLNQFQVRHAEIENNMLLRAKTNARLEQHSAYSILLRLCQMSDELDQVLLVPLEEHLQWLTQLKHRFEKHKTAGQNFFIANLDDRQLGGKSLRYTGIHAIALNFGTLEVKSRNAFNGEVIKRACKRSRISCYTSPFFITATGYIRHSIMSIRMNMKGCLMK